MGEVILPSFTAALNPTLLAATTVMLLLLPHPERLMLGYWLGVMLTSITPGLVIVYALKHSGAVSTTENTVSPVVDIVFGVLTLILAWVLESGRDKRLEERRAKRRKDKKPPRWRKALSDGSARTTFVIGALLVIKGDRRPALSARPAATGRRSPRHCG
jgi:Sap, sulfolipid-1-addressing protein